MSRITFLGNFGVDYSSETHHKKSLEALGHEVIALQETQVGSSEVLKEALQSDLFVWVHTHGWRTPGRHSMARVLVSLKDKGIPTLTYHLDLWLGLQRERDLRTDPVYKYIDHFFTVDKLMADWFNNNTKVKGHYLPAGVFHEEVYEAEKQKAWPKPTVGFIGSKGYHPEWPYRPKLINWLSETYRDQFVHYGGDGLGVVRGKELNQLYRNLDVVIGDSLVKDFSYLYYWSDRLYETIGRGGFLIFPYIVGLEDEFEIGISGNPIELITYKFDNFEELKRLIDYYMNNEKEREVIRKRGFERVKNNYTYKHRWQTILETVGING